MKIFTLAAAAIAFTAVSSLAAPKVAFVSPATDDDEIAAKNWAASQSDVEVKSVGDLASLDVKEYPVVWIMVDQNGIGNGVNNLPADFCSDATVNALKNYSQKGGNLYLSNHATQLASVLGYTSTDRNPGVFGSGDGGSGDDFWTVNPHLGLIFAPGGSHAGEQGYYDRADHPVYAGMTLEDPNNWGFTGYGLIGPGQREDHNCLWDCNLYGCGNELDVIANFEKTHDCTVVGTWGHVQDHCVAALVDFNNQEGVRGRCVANGLAAYEWNQNSGTNVYQGNIEKLTRNVLDYLTPAQTGIDNVAATASEAAYYTLQGVRVAEPEKGLFIVVKDGKASKVIF